MMESMIRKQDRYSMITEISPERRDWKKKKKIVRIQYSLPDNWDKDK